MEHISDHSVCHLWYAPYQWPLYKHRRQTNGPVTGHLWGESIGDRWIPLTKDRLRGKSGNDFPLGYASHWPHPHGPLPLSYQYHISYYCLHNVLGPVLPIPYSPSTTLATAMMTSSNGNIFRVTGHLCGEFTGHRWIPNTKASDAKLRCSLWSAPE